VGPAEPARSGTSSMSRSPVAFGRYVITRRIARGGMAEIYRARERSTDPGSGRWVALKMMRPSLGHEELREQLFKREARIASMIAHGNVLPVFEFGYELDRYYIAMEYVRGRDLSHLIPGIDADTTPLPLGLGLFIGLEASRGLGHAHRLRDPDGHDLQIVHRDISPGNVMVGYDGSVKVLDFGVARINESQGLRTQTGTLRGKFAYMAPEQTLGLAADSRSDVFSFGTLLYELLTGVNPFRERNPVDTLERVQRVRPAPPSRANKSIPKQVDKILARCLAKDPSRRFADGRELHEALGDFLTRQRLGSREELVRYMAGRFAWEQGEELRELRQEEEDVALIEVVDFALGADDISLDAPNVAVPDEQEASQADVRYDVDLAEEGDLVFEDTGDETIAAPSGASPRLIAPAFALAESEATIHQPPPDVGRLRSAIRRAMSAAAREPAPEPTPIAARVGRTPAWAGAGESREVEANSLLGDRASLVPARGASVLAKKTAVAPSPIRPPEADTGPMIAPARPSSIGRFAPIAFGALGAGIAVIAIGMASGRDDEEAPPPPPPTTIAPVTVELRRPAPTPRRNAMIPVAARAPVPPVERAPPPPEPRAPASVRVAAEPEAPTPVAPPPPTPEPAPAPVPSAPPPTPEPAPLAPAPPEPETREAPRRSRVRSRPARPKPARSRPKKAKKAGVGYLNIGAKPWGEIEIDGRPWPYQTPQAGIELPEGKHSITLRNPETGVSKSTTVVIKAGAWRTVNADLRRR
jgi:tRNA A-37 threonylcarbamoyl transferase component Bud32